MLSILTCLSLLLAFSIHIFLILHLPSPSFLISMYIIQTGSSPRDHYKRAILNNETYVTAAKTCNIRLMRFLLEHTSIEPSRILADTNIINGVLLSPCTEGQILTMLQFLIEGYSDTNQNKDQGGSAEEGSSVRVVASHLMLACKLGFLQICKYFRSLPSPIPLSRTFLAEACQVTEYTARNHLRGRYGYQQLLDDYHQSEANLLDIPVLTYLEQTNRTQYSVRNSSGRDAEGRSLNEQFVDFAILEIEKEGSSTPPP